VGAELGRSLRSRDHPGRPLGGDPRGRASILRVMGDYSLRPWSQGGCSLLSRWQGGKVSRRVSPCHRRPRDPATPPHITPTGTPGRIRTCDLPLRRRMLCPLSYWGNNAGKSIEDASPDLRSTSSVEGRGADLLVSSGVSSALLQQFDALRKHGIGGRVESSDASALADPYVTPCADEQEGLGATAPQARH
jgi:hypothetical protein